MVKAAPREAQPNALLAANRSYPGGSILSCQPYNKEGDSLAHYDKHL